MTPGSVTEMLAKLKLLQLHGSGEVSGKASGSKVTGTVVEFLHGKPNKSYTETFAASLG